MSLATVPDIVGYFGSAIVVVLYFLSVQGRIDTTGFRYAAANLLGCFFMIYSLCFNFNAPSMVIELFWASVSLYGIWRSLRKRKERPAVPE